MKRDHAQLIDELSAAYAKRFPRSADLDRRARQVMVDGGSHGCRLVRPFPVRIDSAQGGSIRDVDGHDILDFWQGHFVNILGNNPALVTTALAEAFASGTGLQHGQTEALQIETAELLCRCLGAEKVRFTISGSLATMYAIMMSRAFTGRDLVLKVGGGWHGAQPWGLKGVYFAAGPEPWLPESEGLPAHLTDEVLMTRFNDPEAADRAVPRARRASRLPDRRAVRGGGELHARLARVPAHCSGAGRSLRHGPHLRRGHQRVPLPRGGPGFSLRHTPRPGHGRQDRRWRHAGRGCGRSRAMSLPSAAAKAATGSRSPAAPTRRTRPRCSPPRR